MLEQLAAEALAVVLRADQDGNRAEPVGLAAALAGIRKRRLLPNRRLLRMDRVALGRVRPLAFDEGELKLRKGRV